jgi:hypothetical protein
MARFIIFTIVLFGACGYALLRGRSDERLAGGICITAAIASFALAAPASLRYSGVELGVLAVDLLTLAAFIYIALRSDRFWPLWISGLQLTTTIAHVLKALQPELVPIAYATAGRFWAYPILIIIAVATWRGERRHDREALAAT